MIAHNTLCQSDLNLMGSSMKVHQFARGLMWDHEPSSLLTLGNCKTNSLRPLAPKLPTTDSVTTTTPPFDLKSFIRPDCGPRKLGSPDNKSETPQVETHPGGTRWNPTQEQIGILEMLYRGGMRTPNAQQIEQITAQLGKYGKIEGKNVFYWFQNHKARERQKQKRNSLVLMTNSPRTPPTTTNTITSINLDTMGQVERVVEDSTYKRKSRTWTFEGLEEEKRYCKEEGDKTLELFPLHPEGK